MQEFIQMAETTGKIIKKKSMGGDLYYETIHEDKVEIDKSHLKNTLYKRMG